MSYTLILGTWNSQVGASARLSGARTRCPGGFRTPVAYRDDSSRYMACREYLVSPANNMRGIARWMKANPGNASIQLSRHGRCQQSAGLFPKATATGVVQTSYSTERVAHRHTRTFVAGHIDLMCIPAVGNGRHLRAGAIESLWSICRKAVESAAPDVPTMGVRRPGCTYSVALRGFLGAEGHTARHHRKTQCRGRRGVSGSRQFTSG